MQISGGGFELRNVNMSKSGAIEMISCKKAVVYVVIYTLHTVAGHYVFLLGSAW